MTNFDNIEQLNWDKVDDLMPAIVQDISSGRVLMMGYMNRVALSKTLETRQVTFFSRTKQALWTKGETSGNYLELVELAADCDQDTLLVLAKPNGPTCHLGNTSCWETRQLPSLTFLSELESVIASRKGAATDSSYTARLYRKGTKRIAQKVGEEGVEVALAATVNDNEELLNESADLLYHLTVLLQQQGLSLKQVTDVLNARHK